jgi:hypothetical protein
VNLAAAPVGGQHKDRDDWWEMHVFRSHL